MPKEIYYNNKVVARMLTEEDVADLKLDKKMAIIGYGSQGKGQSLCYKDSEVDVVLGLRKNGNSWKKAVEDGWIENKNLFTVEEAARISDIIFFLAPDYEHLAIYKNIESYVTKGKTLVFAHGFNIHFRQIIPPKNVDVVMIAPKGPGVMVRKEYEKAFGVPALIAVYQDFSGNAKKTILSIAKALGSTKPGILETTFKDETESDLFGEQVLLCGGVIEIANAAYETLIEKGYNPVLAYWECFHELHGLIAPCCYKHGNSGMLRRVSLTARDGAIQSGKRVITKETKEHMEEVLNDIKDGSYAKGLIKRFKEKGINAVDKPIAKMDKTMFEVVGKQVRKVMWPDEDIN